MAAGPFFAPFVQHQTVTVGAIVIVTALDTAGVLWVTQFRAREEPAAPWVRLPIVRVTTAATEE